jgi:hypothetical protein
MVARRNGSRLRYMICRCDLLVGLVLKIAGEAFEFVCTVIPERLALGEGGEDSDLVSSCLSIVNYHRFG